MTDLLARISTHAAASPDVPAYLLLSVKDYDELRRRVVCQPVTPVGVAWQRLQEQEAGNDE